MKPLICLIFSLILSVQVMAQDALSDLFNSEPEQIVNMMDSKDFLIGGVLNPLSGQICLRQTDWVEKGAQSITLERIFLSQYKALNEKSGQIHPSKNSYAGWVYFPHTHLNLFIKTEVGFGITRKETQVCVADPNGTVLTYELKSGKTVLKGESWGISNGVNDFPSGKFDPRNTVISLKSSDMLIPELNVCDVVVKAPDGTERFYYRRSQQVFLLGKSSYNALSCCLHKEILPNGTVLRYSYNKEGLVVRVESLDPLERYIYATLDLSASPFDKSGNSTTGSGARATFTHDSAAYFKEKYQERCLDLLYPLRCQHVSSPFYRDEKIAYEETLDKKSSWLTSYMGKSQIFKCKYLHPRKTDKKHPRSLVTELLFPSSIGKFHSVYTLEYTPVVPGKQEGSTVVKSVDGTKIVYEFNENLLFKKIQYLDEKSTLVKTKTFDWYPNQWLKAICIRDGKGNLLSEKSFEYDTLGNPVVETLRGDLTGSGLIESNTTVRTFSSDGRHLLLSEEFSSGKVITYAYLPGSNLIVSRLTQVKDGDCLLREFYEYDDANNLILQVKDNGSGLNKEDLAGVSVRTITRYILRQEAPHLHMPEWVEEGYLENGEEKHLKFTKLEYDVHGNIRCERVFGADGKFAYSLHKKYNERGDLLSETNALDQEAFYTYDARGREKTAINFANNLCRQTEYDPKGRVILSTERGTDWTQRMYQYQYDHKDRVTSREDQNQLETLYTYDRVLDLATEVISPPIYTLEGKELQVVNRAEYDALGRKIVSIDSKGQSTLYRYNLYDSVTEVCYPDGSRTISRYTRDGRLQSETDADGLTIRYAYNPLGQLICKTFVHQDQVLAKEMFEYQGENLVRHVDKEGNVTQFFFDGAGRKIREEKCGCITTMSYDLLGNVAFIHEENGENSLETHFSYDLLGRVLEKRKTTSDGTLLTQVFYAYDPDGNISDIQREINGQLVTELFVYDSHHRQVSYLDPFSNQTTTQYDEQALNPFGQLVLKRTVTDPHDISIVEMHDVYGRVVKSSTLNAFQEVIASEEKEYDPCGNLSLHEIDTYRGTELFDTKSICFAYDSNHRVKSCTRAFDTPDARQTEFTYTPGGKLKTKTLPDHLVLTYSYDGLGNRSALSSSDGKIAHCFTYNLQGELLSATDELQKITIERTLDPHGHVLVEQFFNPDCKPYSIQKTFDLLHRPLSCTLPDGSAVLYERDPVYLKTVLRMDASGNIKYKHQYASYDLSGYLIGEHLIANLGAVQHETDSLGRCYAISSPYFSHYCTFDKVGNLTKTTRNGEAFYYKYDALSQLINEADHAYRYDSTYNRTQENDLNFTYNALDEHLACTYDLRGNLISKTCGSERATFAYDPLNRLIEVINTDTKVCYSYDPLGRRIAKKLYRLSGAEWKEESCECILYDQNNDIGTLSPDGVIKQLRILGIFSHPETPATIAIELDDHLYAPILDCQGNIRGLMEASTNAIAATYEYTAFGEQTISNEVPFNPWQYASKRLDLDTGLIDFGKRHYDPSFGRWLSPDPAGFINSTNLYQFNFNNPFRYIDPDGQAVLLVPCIKVAFDLVVTWITAEAAICTAATIGAYYLGSTISEAVNSDATDTGTETQTEAKPKGKRKGGGSQQTSGTFTTLRPLPITEDGVLIPDVDVPHTQLGTREGSKGKYPQAREFGYDGVPVRTIDFTDHGFPENHTNPHQHLYKPNPTGGTPGRDKAMPVSGWTYMI